MKFKLKIALLATALTSQLSAASLYSRMASCATKRTFPLITAVPFQRTFSITTAIRSDSTKPTSLVPLDRSNPESLKQFNATLMTQIGNQKTLNNLLMVQWYDEQYPSHNNFGNKLPFETAVRIAKATYWCEVYLKDMIIKMHYKTFKSEIENYFKALSKDEMVHSEFSSGISDVLNELVDKKEYLKMVESDILWACFEIYKKYVVKSRSPKDDLKFFE